MSKSKRSAGEQDNGSCRCCSSTSIQEEKVRDGTGANERADYGGVEGAS